LATSYAERLFTFTRLPPSRWKSARTINAIVQAADQDTEGLPLAA
jgi:hypothetical protein